MSGLIGLKTALGHLAQLAPSLESEYLPLADCPGRVLAGDVTARTTLPPADVSAMDGYAVRLEDTRKAGSRLELAGTSPAGRPAGYSLSKHQAMRIFTGGSLPEGADHILIQEETRREDGQVVVLVPQTQARHIRKAGLDFEEGQLLLRAGSRLGPAELALAAAANHDRLEIVRRPRVFIITSGDELRPPGSRLAPGQIIDSNSYALAALVRHWGADAVPLGIAADSTGSIRNMIDGIGEADLIVAVGGASVGDRDLMRAAFKASGARMVFEKVAIKPGKPSWCALLEGQPVIGLPGNPATAYVCAHLFLPVLLGRKAIEPVEAVLSQALPGTGDRECFLRAELKQKNGMTTVSLLAQQDTSMLSALLKADCLLHRPANDIGKAEGMLVTCLPLVRP